MLYFAYGSNLDQAQWGRWCAEHGHDPQSIELLGPAWLPDHEPVFHYRSRVDAQGRLDVRPRVGTTTPGALFRVRDWTALDVKEGVAGRYYERVDATVLTDDGNAHQAVTYRVCSQRVQGHIAPSPEYFGYVQRGLFRLGHAQDQLVAAANDQPLDAVPNQLFAYGTLMQGHRGHDLVEARLGAPPVDATVHGASLVRIDWYPGLVLSEGGSVRGQLMELRDMGAALAVLDAYEDFAGYGAEGSLYRRSLVRSHTASGESLAWTYVYLGDTGATPPIASGVWEVDEP